MKKSTDFQDELCCLRKIFWITEKSGKHWNHFYHENSNTEKHTHHEKHRIGHCSFDFSSNGVDFFCLLCNLEKCLIQFSCSFSGFYNRCFRSSKTSIITFECFMHTSSSLHFFDHIIIEFDHIFFFFLFS